MKITASIFGVTLFLTACSEPPKPQVPSLTPEVANQVLHYNSKAEGWIAHAKKQDPSCAYQLDIPDQSSHPTQLDFSHIVKCGGRVSPLELDASVSFEYDKDAQHWVISRFSD
jgi:hypothetical protein